MAYYPSNVRSDFTIKQNFIDIIENYDVNDVQSEITAIETYLGTNPHISAGWSGSFNSSQTTWPDLKTRIQNIEYGLTSVLSLTASSLTGTTLASNIVTSSLTSVGTLTSLNVSGTATAGSFSGDGSGLTNVEASSLGIMVLMGAWV